MSTYTQILYQVVFGSKDYTSFLTRVNQEKHHKKFSFKEELMVLYKEHDIEFDEKYLIT